MSHRSGDRSIFRRVFIRILPVYHQAFTRLSMTTRRSFYFHQRSEEHTSELQSHSDLHSFPTRRSSDLRAVTIYEAAKQGWPTDRSYWQFLAPFQYVSPKWGPIDIPKGFYTDFASVPPSLHSIIDDDSPIILFPSEIGRAHV